MDPMVRLLNQLHNMAGEADDLSEMAEVEVENDTVAAMIDSTASHFLFDIEHLHRFIQWATNTTCPENYCPWAIPPDKMPTD